MCNSHIPNDNLLNHIGNYSYHKDSCFIYFIETFPSVLSLLLVSTLAWYLQWCLNKLIGHLFCVCFGDQREGEGKQLQELLLAEPGLSQLGRQDLFLTFPHLFFLLCECCINIFLKLKCRVRRSNWAGVVLHLCSHHFISNFQEVVREYEWSISVYYVMNYINIKMLSESMHSLWRFKLIELMKWFSFVVVFWDRKNPISISVALFLYH